MPLTNPYQQYRQTAVHTADKGDLLIMTYEAVLRWLARARVAIEKDELVESHEALVNAQKLISNLAMSLDIERGGEIAANLQRLYEFINDRLVWTNIQKDLASIDTVCELIRPLLDAWRVAVAQTRKDPSLLAAAAR